jgi:hypothetical protein
MKASVRPNRRVRSRAIAIARFRRAVWLIRPSLLSIDGSLRTVRCATWSSLLAAPSRARGVADEMPVRQRRQVRVGRREPARAWLLHAGHGCPLTVSLEEGEARAVDCVRDPIHANSHACLAHRVSESDSGRAFSGNAPLARLVRSQRSPRTRTRSVYFCQAVLTRRPPIEIAALAPSGQVFEPWNDPPAHIVQVAVGVRDFLPAHSP